MPVPAPFVAVQGGPVISADNLNTLLQAGLLAADLRQISGEPGMCMMLSGINSVNDGAGGFFYWNASGDEVDDNYNYIVPYGAAAGLWQRLTLPGGGGGGTIPAVAEISAAGTDQETAAVLTAQVNIVTSVAPGTGVILQLMAGSPTQTVINAGSNPLSVYPSVGGQIGALGTNKPSGVYMGNGNNYSNPGVPQWAVW